MPIKDIEKFRILSNQKIRKEGETILKLLNDHGETIKLRGRLQWTIPFPHGSEECYRAYKNGTTLRVNLVLYNQNPELNYASVVEQPTYC